MTPIDTLLEIMARLRDPKGGCAWDRQQTFDTIAPYTVEEAFEVADAIAARDWPELREELGDLLLQVVFHARMAQEQGLFSFTDVVTTLNEKLVRRHPHVFDSGAASSTDIASIKAAWEQIKTAERNAKGRDHSSQLDGVPAGLPALQQATTLQKKAAHVGFDWPDAFSVLPQVRAELDELAAAMTAGDVQHIEEELGDVLFTAVNLSRHLRVDPDLALRRASHKFRSRFMDMERQASSSGQTLSSLDAAALEELWCRAKRNLRHRNSS